jgi:hypothetical protein
MPRLCFDGDTPCFQSGICVFSSCSLHLFALDSASLKVNLNFGNVADTHFWFFEYFQLFPTMFPSTLFNFSANLYLYV